MKTIATGVSLRFDEKGKGEIILNVETSKNELLKSVGEFKDVISKDKKLSVEIKQYRQSRSLDANGYLWGLLGQMADVLKTTKDELYLIMLERYGVFTHIVVKPNVVEKVKQEWRTVRELGEVTINGKTGIQLQCYFGSHSYDTKEFSVLLDGVISEAKELGIDIIPESEKALLIDKWGRKQ